MLKPAIFRSFNSDNGMSTQDHRDRHNQSIQGNVLRILYSDFSDLKKQDFYAVERFRDFK